MSTKIYLGHPNPCKGPSATNTQPARLSLLPHHEGKGSVFSQFWRILCLDILTPLVGCLWLKKKKKKKHENSKKNIVFNRTSFNVTPYRITLANQTLYYPGFIKINPKDRIRKTYWQGRMVLIPNPQIVEHKVGWLWNWYTNEILNLLKTLKITKPFNYAHFFPN